jgi:hypothetical protein
MILLVPGLISLVLAGSAVAQLQDENAVKVAYVYNLTKYVQWPQPSHDLVIGFIGEGPMGELLKKALDGKSIDTGQIRVVVSPSDDQLQHCNLLYVGYSSSKQVHAVLQKVGNKEILTVGDWEFFAKEGGMIGLVRNQAQVQIQVNADVTRDSTLKISSRLLNLAIIVRSESGGKS